ncbi:hypothetical protein MPSEU_000901100 [Mayamaea pseudoterrestris]|nr:hypothetical protein MPSEU_000901100 [Mayamaea pseudoterrestris]
MAPVLDNNPQAGAGRPLPKKEQDMFRTLQKHFDTKQYKKALKQADAILKKFPKHGETLAMKGLTLSSTGKGGEAQACVKEGLMNDMNSHMCWHVFGLLHRNERNYNEAIKAYKRALRIDNSNLNILRDLSMLQIQMRDLIGFEETRATILQLRPSLKIHWMALALAKHQTGELTGAIEVIDTYLRTLNEGSEELGRCIESSELAMYKNRILAEMPNNYDEALHHLDVCEETVVDRGAWLFSKAEYSIKLRDFARGREAVMAMFDRGMTEDYRIHSMYMCILLDVDADLCDKVLGLRGSQTLASMVPLTGNQKKVLREAYELDLQVRYPDSYAAKQIPITFLDGEAFRFAVDQLCRKHLSQGVPSLCHELHSFLWIERDDSLLRPNDPVDLRLHSLYKVYTDVVDGFISSLAASSKFAESDADEEPQTTILWAWYLRAGLHELVAEYVDAVILLNKCIEHTPDAVDVYLLKARILYKSGDCSGAVECIEKGRELDKQDRYMNNETTRYMLLAGMEEEAMKIISLFAKHEGNSEQNLFEMQCSWYELEMAACCFKKQDMGRSLKKYAAVLKHFEDIRDDQFDFHGYCLKKVTFRSYVDMLRFEDSLFGQEYYVKAALGTIHIYLVLYDRPIISESDEPDYSLMTSAERKKAKAIARKKKKASVKVEADVHEISEANGNHAKAPSAKTEATSFIEIDPLGKDLLAKDPLLEASKLSAVLVYSAPRNIDSWIARYDVAIRRKKVMMSLQSLYKARSIDPANAALFTRTVDFFVKRPFFGNLSDQSQAFVDEAAPTLLNDKDLVVFIQEAAKAASTDELTALPLRVAIAKALVETKAGSVVDACALIVDCGIKSRGVSVDTCSEALSVLKSLGSGAEQATKMWIAAVKAQFPLLPTFE